MNLGNLFTEAGYNVIESKAFIHKWPPHYYNIAKIFGGKMFHKISKVYGFIKRHTAGQVRVIAEKA